MFNGDDGGNLTKLRYKTFMSHAVSCKAHDPSLLPPSERSAIYHAYRVHYQVSQWKTLSTNTLNPTEWGWVLQGSSLFPIKTDVSPAPEELLKGVSGSENYFPYYDVFHNYFLFVLHVRPRFDKKNEKKHE